jgi:hypothetical protein
MPLRRSIFLFLLLTVCAPVFASEARGYVFAQCPMTGDSILHITRLDGRKLNPELYVRIPEEGAWGRYKDWYEMQGACLPTGECEPNIRSRAQIVRVSRNHFPLYHRDWITSISGNFEIKLADGTKLAGQFKARYRVPRKHQCE